jgi:hypothetical protein
MQEKENWPTFLPIGDGRPFILKIWMPVLSVAGPALVMFSPPTTIPAVILGIFLTFPGLFLFFQAGIVKADPDCLHYRRFFNWRRIAYQDIVECDGSRFPGLNHLKLKTPEGLLGKLYYIPWISDPPYWPSQRRKLDHEALEYIQARVGKSSESLPLAAPQTQAKSSKYMSRSTATRAALCACSGGTAAAVILILRCLVWRDMGFPPPTKPGLAWPDRLMEFPWHLFSRLLDWPYNLVAVLSLLAVIFMTRFGRWAPSLASGVGAILGGIIARMILRA